MLLQLILFLQLPSGDASQLSPQLSLQSTDLPAMVRFVNPDEYILGVGDRLWLSIPGGIPFISSGETIQSLVELPVSLDGNISLPGFRPIAAAGMTLADCSSVLLGLLNARFGSLGASVGLASSAYFQIPVTGAVSEPGVVQVSGLDRLSYAIEAAGGALPNASLSEVMMISATGDTLFYNVNSFLANGFLEENPLVRRDGRIHLPRADSFVFVQGAANGIRAVLEFSPEESPLEAVQRAGGFMSEARVDTICVLRNGSPLMVGANAASRFTLEPGDEVMVLNIPSTVAVSGSVAFPGPVPYSPGMDASYYIGMVGGYTPDARRSGTVVISPSGNERTQADRVELIQPGSMIDVPRKPLAAFQEYITIVAGIATVLIAYSTIK
ncbi:MAG: SLBB domain-containing protein [Candidatus Fermentibacteraceae bacterium]